MKKLLALLTAIVAVPASFAGAVEIDPRESILAVVTHKAGFASGLAHNHLVAAEKYEIDLKFDPSATSETRFRFRVKAADLVVDRPDIRTTWFPRLRELGILEEPFSDISDAQRSKIRGAMLSERQLDAESFPDISASVSKVVEGSTDVPGFPYTVTLALEVRGKRVERDVAARYSRSGEPLTIEATGVFRFTEFGIKPYSAMLGAVRNTDEFHVYVHLTATPAETPSGPLPLPQAPSRTSGT